MQTNKAILKQMVHALDRSAGKQQNLMNFLADEQEKLKRIYNGNYSKNFSF